jgi:hypothetical protein
LKTAELQNGSKLMNKLSLLICLLIAPGSYFSPLSAQDMNYNLRTLDNNAALRADSNDHKFNRAIKNIPLSSENPATNLSIGGEIREQLRMYSHVNYGDVDSGVNDNDVYLLQRYLLHADLHLGRHLRFFGQFNSNHATAKNSVAHTDRDVVGVLQAFADINILSRIPVRLRLGRQELSYGVERILGTRDGANVRQSFDGLRYTMTLKKSVADFFVVYPVNYEFGYFDNSTNTDILIYSGLWSVTLNRLGTLELYFIGNDRKFAYCRNDSAKENRQSFGIRLSKYSGIFYYDAEAIGQTGIYGNASVRAWQLSAVAGLRWRELRMEPRVQVRIAGASGDLDSSDTKMNLFRPIATRSPVNDLIPVGFANIGVFTVEAEIKIIKGLHFGLGYYAVRRISPNDGSYTSDVTHMVREPDNNGIEKGIRMAEGVVSDINYAAGKHFAILLLMGYFVPGNYVSNTGEGKTQSAASLKVTYRF